MFSLRSVIRNSLQCSDLATQSIFARFMFSPSWLGINGYRDKRLKIAYHQLGSSRDQLLSELEQQQQPPAMEQLQQLLHIVTASEQDQTLLTRLLVRYNEHSKTATTTPYTYTYIFGPIVMRMYWHFGLADKAMEVFQSPDLVDLFAPLTCVVVLMDLLYEQERYTDVLTVFDTFQSRQDSLRYPSDCVLLSMAACYQQNTPESCDYVRALWSAVESSHPHEIDRSAAALGAALLLKNGAPHEALVHLQQLEHSDRHSYSILRDVEAMCLAELGRPAEAVQVLQKPLLMDQTDSNRRGVVTDAIELVEAAVQKKHDAVLKANWEGVKKGLQSYKLLHLKSLHEVLSTPQGQKRKWKKWPSPLSATFNRGQRAVRTPLRPGLADMTD